MATDSRAHASPIRHASGVVAAAQAAPHEVPLHQSLTLEELALLGVLSTSRSRQITVEVVNRQVGPRARAARSLAARGIIDWLGCAVVLTQTRRSLRVRYGLTEYGQQLLDSLCESTR